MNWYGIKEACKLVGKSESTLRKIAKTKRKGVKFETLPTGHKKILFSDEFLTIEFGDFNNSFNNSATIETHSDSSKMIDILHEQLKAKDVQIENLSERLKEAHILTANLENKLSLAIPPPPEQRQRKRFLFW